MNPVADTLRSGLALLERFEREGKTIHAGAVRRSLHMALDFAPWDMRHSPLGALRLTTTTTEDHA